MYSCIFVRRLAVVLILLYIFANFYRLFFWSSQIKISKRNDSSQGIHLGLSREVGQSDRLRWLAHYSVSTQRIYGAPNGGNDVNSSKSPQRKFLFAFRHYDQLGGGTENLLEFCSLAAYGGRDVVAPFVNNSRMAGTRGVGHLIRRNQSMTFVPFDTYFNFSQVNDRLRSNGYSTLTTFDEMARSCNHRVNVVVHFLYHDKKSIADTIYWYQIKEKDIRDIYLRAKQNNGWTNCPEVRKSDLSEQLGGFKIGRYVCVDPEIIRSSEILEDVVLQDANCVVIVQWKGVGPNRAHFSLASNISHRLHRWDLKHNQQLINIAEAFVKTSRLGKSFISVHVRAEHHIFRRGVNITRQCFHKLASSVQKLRINHNWNVYLASDIVDYGSDTLFQDLSEKQRLALYKDLNKMLNYPITLSPIEGLYDTGAIAIIEMHILSAGKKLVTLGGGSYQEWLVKLFSQNVRNTTHSLYRICE